MLAGCVTVSMEWCPLAAVWAIPSILQNNCNLNIPIIIRSTVGFRLRDDGDPTYRWTSGVRDDKPPKLAAKVLISICLRDDDPSAFWSSM